MSDAPTYPEFVRALFAGADDVRPNLDQDDHQWPHDAAAALHCAVEAGEIMDELKRVIAYGKPYDPDRFGGGNGAFDSALETAELDASFADMEDWEIEFAHAAIGLFTEAGELMEQLYARVCKGQPMDAENLNEETGDAGFYLQAAVNVLVDKLGQRHPEEGNREKLVTGPKARFPDAVFDAGAAMARADKATGEGRTVTVTIEEDGDGTISCEVSSDRPLPESGEDASFPEKIAIACLRHVGQTLRGPSEKKPSLIALPGGKGIQH